MGISTLFVLSFLVVLKTLAIDIPSTPTWPSNRCTDKSLTIPSWIVLDYKVVSGTATFQIDSRASELKPCCAFFTCYPGRTGCSGHAGAADFRVDWSKAENGRSVISINEFWSCEDVADRTTFSAKGNATITSCSGSDCVSPITYLAQGSLSLPIPLTPAQPSPPPGYNAPSCASVGKNQWTVSDVEYKNYTKGQCTWWYSEDQVCLEPGQTGLDFISKGEYLALKMTNKAISNDIVCNFTASYKAHDLPHPLRCTGSGKFNEIILDVSLSGTGPNFSLHVEELWYCLENSTTNDKPSVIIASGSIPLPLVCETHTGITGTADDIVTICTDSVSSHAVDGVQVAKQTLPAFSLVTAFPVHGGCTYDSVINPTFYYRRMSFTTNPFSPSNPNNITLSKFNAGIWGPGFPLDWMYEDKAISGSGVDTVYNCNIYYDGKAKEDHYNCTYAFNPHTKVISQTKAWKCADKNQSQPLYFEGSGSFDWSKYPYYACDTRNNQIRCEWSERQNLAGIPYDIPKVTASLYNVLPPDYGWMGVSSDTVRVNGKWRMVDGGL